MRPLRLPLILAFVVLVLGGCARQSLLTPTAVAAYVAAGADPKELRERDDAAIYRVEAAYRDGVVTGTVRMAWKNTTGAPLQDLVFQQYPNDPVWHGATMAVSATAVDGQPVAGAVVRDGLGWRVPLARPLAPGTQVAVDLTFRHALSTTGGYHGLGTVDRPSGVAVLHGWFPELALWRDGAWQVDALPELCDPARSWLYHVQARLEVDDGTAIPAGGRMVVDDLPGPRRILELTCPFARNLTVVLGKWESLEQEVDGVLVRVWHRGQPHAAKRALARTILALNRCRRFAPPPRPELDVVLAGNLGESVGGIESSGLVLIGGSSASQVELMGDDPPASALPVFMFDMTVVHEVAHQWWYDLVGNDPLPTAWLDESLTNWTSGWILEGDSAQVGTWAWRMIWTQAQMRGRKADANGDLYPAIDRPLWTEPGDPHGSQVYGRGALAYQALRKQVGDEAWLNCLTAWAAGNRWRLIDNAAWRRHLEQKLGKPVVDAFWDRWIQGHGLKPLDLAKVLN